MVILTGRNLGERQKELNAKVKEAASQHVNFDEIKDTAEESDVDKLFKIDLASKYKNIDYLIEVLKSGDSLYISRALKCSWIYGDDFSHVINVDNLQKNVIPFMSSKMNKKLLTAISVHVRNESRAAEFYKYCRDIKLKGIALKFLIFTSENFKLEALKDKSISHYLVMERDSEYLKNFVGLSFTLAEAYVKVFERTNSELFRGLSYLYTVSEVKYLDLLKNFIKLSSYNNHCLGLRISRSIMKHHKDRVLKNPCLYLKILSQSAVTKYSSADDAKIFTVAVLPDTARDFWYLDYCSKYKFILDKIVVGKFQYVKQIFTNKYPEEEFETTYDFYQKEYNKLMTAEEQETWALQHLASEAEILGVGKDYLWYKFVSFEKAFPEIKKLVLITPDNTTRADMILILADSAKNQRDVEKLMNHYYERHVNEPKFVKENFLDRILQNFNVFEFDENCWTAFNKMFHNLEVYNLTDYNSKREYRIIALIYNMINEKELPEVIKKHIDNEMPFYCLKTFTDKLTKEQQEIVFNYLFNFYMDKIRNFENVPYTDEVKFSLRKYIHIILDLLVHYERTKEDCPELVNNFMNLDWYEFEGHELLREESQKELTVADLLRDLKKDANLFKEHVPRIHDRIDDNGFQISAFLRKLKIYFSNDFAKDYLRLFESFLTVKQLWHKPTHAAAHGIFQLGDEKFKINFMEKYAPDETKINHSEIEKNLLKIQQAICAQALYSRPPVPLKSMLMYVKGDYVQYCLPLFNSYLANLPLPLCMEFVEALLDTQVSIQKHGIRLAFECFNTESLNTLVLRAWKKTKNVSLRLIIYKAIINKITQVSSGQDLLFDTLKKLTLTLQPDDNEEIFSLLISRRLPEHLTLECIEMAWKVVSQFPPKSANLRRMRNVIMCISTKIDKIRQEFVREIIETFIASVFIQEEEQSTKLSNDADALIDAKWNLTATYIINVKGEEDIGEKKELAKLIMKKKLDPQETRTREKKRALLKTCFSFIHDLENRSYAQDFHRYENVNSIMQLVLETLENAFTIEEIYMEVWEIRLGIVVRKAIADSKIRLGQEINKEKIKDIANKFAYKVGVLIKEFIEKDLFFTTFLTDIKNKIVSKTQTLKNLINSDTEFTDMLIYVCLGLLTIENPQVYLLVLDLLPDNCHCDNTEDFKVIIEKINKMNNKEIRCNVIRKLATSNLDDKACTARRRRVQGGRQSRQRIPRFAAPCT